MRGSSAQEYLWSGEHHVGLAVVQRTIEYWGGSILVESEVGEGTRFTFSLPRADA